MEVTRCCWGKCEQREMAGDAEAVPGPGPGHSRRGCAPGTAGRYRCGPLMRVLPAACGAASMAANVAEDVKRLRESLPTRIYAMSSVPPERS